MPHWDGFGDFSPFFWDPGAGYINLAVIQILHECVQRNENAVQYYVNNQGYNEGQA